MAKKAAGWLLVALIGIIYLSILYLFVVGAISDGNFVDNFIDWTYSLPHVLGFFVLFGSFLGLAGVVTALVTLVGEKLIKW